MADIQISAVLREHKGPAGALSPEYLEMQSMRRAFLRSWNAWLLTHPATADIGDESDSTLRAVGQFAEMHGVRDVRLLPRGGR